VLEQVLDYEEYQRHRGELVNLFMGLKHKIKIEYLTLYEPIFTLYIQKSKSSICQEFANIHCIICGIITTSGYVLTTSNNIKQNVIIKESNS
jgi:hypothetical protein